MFIKIGKSKLLGRKVRNYNKLSNRNGWMGTIVDEDDTHILVQYDNQPESTGCTGFPYSTRYPYTLQTYMKGRKQKLQLLKKGS